MKMIIALLTLLTSAYSFAGPASAFVGEYTVVRGCKANTSRITPLNLLYFEGTPVTIEVDQARELLLITAEHNTSALPFSSDTDLEPVSFGRYYSNADIRVTKNSYAMRTKGSEWKTCDLNPLPGSYPCRQKWDDAVGMIVDAQGNLRIEFKTEGSGTCLLERVK